MEILKTWIMSMAGAAVLTALCMAVTPEGQAKKAVKFVCGLVMIICFAAPIIGGLPKISLDISRFSADAGDIMSRAEENTETVTRTLIQSQCETYISDKGKLLGLEELEVSVEVRWSEEGYWYPVSAEIQGAVGSPETISSLEWYITTELGIQEDAIYWS